MRRSIVLPMMAAAAVCAAAPALARERPPLRRAPNYAPPQALQPSDPLEGVNRAMFSIDKRISKAFGGRSLDPGKAVPSKIRPAVYNVFSNLDEPVSAANQLLQGKVKRAAVSVGRFATNTTVGLLGTRDVATGWGMRRHREDFGQTLAKYGVPSGPYIYLPLLGPSTMRDKLAGQVDGMAQPLGWVETGTMGGHAINGVENVVQPPRATIRQRGSEAAEAGATYDEYATVRAFYYAKRAAEIEDAAGADEVPMPNWRSRQADVQYARVREQPRPRRGQPYRTANSPEYASSQAAYDAYGYADDGPAWVGADDDWVEDPG
jgi:phospholipid-binding lipoprotein MlaA